MRGVELHHGDCLEVMRSLPDDSVHAVVTDPPYGLGFMGKAWDDLPPGREWAEECLRVLKPGGYLLAFGGTRTFHRLAVAVEDAGFEIRDSIAWLYGSGMPKSWNFGTQYQGAWCACESGNALPLNHADNADMHGVRDAVHAATVTRGEGEGTHLLAEVQRGESRPGLGRARTQGPSSVDTCSGGELPREAARRTEPSLAGRDVHRAGQGLPDGSATRAPAGTGEWVRRGASAGDGADSRAASLVARGSASHQRGSGGQPSGELAAVPGSHEPLDDGALRDGPVCSRCGGLDPAFKGFGTGIKPSFEPIVVARKPLAGTVAANVQAWGTGALHIDACRVGGGVPRPAREAMGGSGNVYGAGLEGGRVIEPTTAGRWPANVALDGDMADELDAQSAGTRAAKAAASGSGGRKLGYHGGATTDVDIAGYGDSGGASRFFPVFRYQAKAPTRERVSYVKDDGTKVAHATVKPLELMRWLARLVTPPGGVCLEPFAGSGTTVEACILEGFECIAIEREAEYLPLIQQRIDRHDGTLDLGVTA